MLPPIEQISYDLGSGRVPEARPAAAARLTSTLSAPGSTTATRLAVSISMARIRSVDSTMPPSTASAPPDSPSPRPAARPGCRARSPSAWSPAPARRSRPARPRAGCRRWRRGSSRSGTSRGRPGRSRRRHRAASPRARRRQRPCPHFPLPCPPFPPECGSGRPGDHFRTRGWRCGELRGRLGRSGADSLRMETWTGARRRAGRSPVRGVSCASSRYRGLSYATRWSPADGLDAPRRSSPTTTGPLSREQRLWLAVLHRRAARRGRAGLTAPPCTV